MSKNSAFQNRVIELQTELDKLEGQLNKKAGCVPTLLIIGACIPVVVWFMLFFFQPGFVKKKEGSRQVRDNSKVFGWTIGITLFLWAGMYVFAYFKGYDIGGSVCHRS